MSFDWDNIDDIKRLEEILKQGFAREISSFEIYNEPFNDISITTYNNNNAIIYKTVINLLAQNDYSAEIFERAFNFKKEMIYGYPANDILYTKNN